MESISQSIFISRFFWVLSMINFCATADILQNKGACSYICRHVLYMYILVLFTTSQYLFEIIFPSAKRVGESRISSHFVFHSHPSGDVANPPREMGEKVAAPGRVIFSGVQTDFSLFFFVFNRRKRLVCIGAEYLFYLYDTGHKTNQVFFLGRSFEAKGFLHLKRTYVL